jgi:hypothetical protein
MYGAFWCTHCYDQKQEFGQQAMAEFPYVECFPQGWKKVSVEGHGVWLGRGQAWVHLYLEAVCVLRS